MRRIHSFVGSAWVVGLLLLAKRELALQCSLVRKMLLIFEIAWVLR